jgi:hypothetical protein
MGLDCSHDAWHGAYSAFNSLRQKVAEAMGGSYPPHNEKTLDEEMWYWGRGYNADTHPGLLVFLRHSDCDGHLTPRECRLVAKDLEALLPEIEKLDDGGLHGGWSISRTGDGTFETATHPGHIAAAGGYVAATKRFIDGCRKAAKANQRLRFR